MRSSLGNVWESVLDWYGPYEGGTMTDPNGATDGSHRVFRGASWFSANFGLRLARRGGGLPEHRSTEVGIRLVRTGL